MKQFNLGLRFMLELALLIIFAYWGFQTHTDTASWLLGLGTPVAAAAVWGVFLAPKSQRRLQNPSRFWLEIALFGLAVLALLDAQRAAAAVLFGVLVAINMLLMKIWKQ